MIKKYLEFIDNSDSIDESDLLDLAKSVEDKEFLLRLAAHYGSIAGGGYAAIPDEDDTDKLLLVKASTLLTREEIENEFVSAVLSYKENIRKKNELKKIKLNTRRVHFMNSYQDSSEINPEEFMNDVTDFINGISNERTRLSDALVPVICPNGYKYIVFLHHNGEICEYTVTEHITTAVSKMVSKLNPDDIDDYEISYSTISKDIYGDDVATAVGIITKCRNVIISDNSNVFIDNIKLYSYVSNVYGLTNPMLKKFLSNNPDITQYLNGGHIIYFKSEINRRIEKDSKNGLFSKNKKNF